MKYSEYKAQKSQGASSNDTPIDTKKSLQYYLIGLMSYLDDPAEHREAYMRVREMILDHEIEYTEEDFEKFEKNFNAAMEQLLYTDEDEEISIIDEAVTMMDSIDWTWGAKNKHVDKEDIINTIKDFFETCMNSGQAQYRVDSGGIVVETDIIDHTVEIRVADRSWEEYDQD